MERTSGTKPSFPQAFPTSVSLAVPASPFPSHSLSPVCPHPSSSLKASSSLFPGQGGGLGIPQGFPLPQAHPPSSLVTRWWHPGLSHTICLCPTWNCSAPALWLHRQMKEKEKKTPTILVLWIPSAVTPPYRFPYSVPWLKLSSGST